MRYAVEISDVWSIHKLKTWRYYKFKWQAKFVVYWINAWSFTRSAKFLGETL